MNESFKQSQNLRQKIAFVKGFCATSESFFRRWAFFRKKYRSTSKNLIAKTSINKTLYKKVRLKGFREKLRSYFKTFAKWRLYGTDNLKERFQIRSRQGA
ncbi:MAG: hypothetical protein EAZ92_04160 [Candidatus Kapaibacterium sp.]|nr:MAG: hypothetical protein EAZ92_04160 [Candidatus Kapabacteria bacterium]